MDHKTTLVIFILAVLVVECQSLGAGEMFQKYGKKRTAKVWTFWSTVRTQKHCQYGGLPLSFYCPAVLGYLINEALAFASVDENLWCAI